jgi:hypothetical protein
MNHTIFAGAYGWRHRHWLKTFYPQDLPSGGTEDDAEDWRLSYYSNQFDSVMVPADYWNSNITVDCGSWLDDVHEKFRFVVECRRDMFSYISIEKFSEYMKVLQPKLAALILLDGVQSQNNSGLESGQNIYNGEFDLLLDVLHMSISAEGVLIDLGGDFQQVNVFRQAMPDADDDMTEGIWPTNFAIYENDLTDLRKARKVVESFLTQKAGGEQQQESGSSVIIVKHSQLQVENLSNFCSMLEIMGY